MARVVSQPGRFRASSGMIKHYDRFIGGHDSTVNHWPRVTRGSGSDLNDRVTVAARPRARASFYSKQIGGPITGYSVPLGEERTRFLTLLMRSCTVEAGQVIAAGSESASARQQRCNSGPNYAPRAA